MSNKIKRGRRTKPYRTSWGETIDGLYRRPDGRWRIVAIRHDFREADERLAVARFKQWLCKQQTSTTTITSEASSRAIELMSSGAVVLVGNSDGSKQLELGVPDELLYPWLRKQLLSNAVELAQKVGIPQLASISTWQLPEDS